MLFYIPSTNDKNCLENNSKHKTEQSYLMFKGINVRNSDWLHKHYDGFQKIQPHQVSIEKWNKCLARVFYHHYTQSVITSISLPFCLHLFQSTPVSIILYCSGMGYDHFPRDTYKRTICNYGRASKGCYVNCVGSYSYVDKDTHLLCMQCGVQI